MMRDILLDIQDRAHTMHEFDSGNPEKPGFAECEGDGCPACAGILPLVNQLLGARDGEQP